MTAGWQRKTLRDVCHVYQPETIAQKQLVVGECPVFGANGQIGWHDRFNHEDPQLILGCRGSCGTVHMTPPRSWINGNAMVVQADSSVIDRAFLAYALKGGADLSSAITGAAQPQITRASLMPISISFPSSLPEQQRIVAILDKAFDGIATAKANAEKNLQNARALFESHLESVFTQHRDGWTEESVAELVADGVLAKPFDGNHGEIHPRKSDYTKSGVPFIMASDLRNGGVDTENCKFISRELADSLRVGFARDGDVLISHKGTIGRSAIVSTKDEYIMLTPQVTSYRVNDTGKLFNRFVRYYFMSPAFQKSVVAGAEGGATRAYIGITKQLALRFRFPCLNEQHQIASRLDALEPETQRLGSIYQRKLAALDALKKSLLHQAFSGNL